MVSIVYMVAGMSSRFGGKIKQFARVGPQGETLIEVSINQAITAGFDKIIFIVGEKTETPFKEMFGNEYNGIPIEYAKQTFNPELRDKPWGTCDAVVCAKDVIKEDFVVCNGDDLYGKNSMKQIHDFLKSTHLGVTNGYKLKNIIPEKGTVNRALFETDEDGNVIHLKEIFDISKENFSKKNLTPESLCSMNIFGLPKEILDELEIKLNQFKIINKGDRKAECLLPAELNNLINENKITIKLLKTDERWLGVTNPEDEEVVRKILEEN